MNRELYYYDEKTIKELLMFRKIIKAENYTLYLDNGVELEVCPNSGCGGCCSGWYELVELNDCDNAITNVEFVVDDIYSEDSYNDMSYKIFVYAEDKRIKVLQVDGTDGNGYYGTGYTVIVKEKN